MMDLYNNIIISSGGVNINEINVFFLFLISLFASVVYHINTGTRGDISIILGLNIVGLLMMVLSEDLITLFISLELYSLSVYLLVFKYYHSVNVSTALLYFILGAISSSIILLAIAIIYSYTGCLDFSMLNWGWDSSGGITIGVTLLSLGLLFKVGSAPFQYWVIKVYSKLDLPILMYLTVLPKFVFVYVLSKRMGGDVVYIAGILSLLVGSIAPHKKEIGNDEKGFKTLIAYSSIYNIGFLLLGLTGSSFFQYLVIYALSTYHLFLGYTTITTRTGGTFFITVLISVFSFIGFPPFAGFFAKLNILLISLNSDYLPLFTFLVILVSSAAAAFVYLKFIPCLTAQRSETSQDVYLYSFLTIFISCYTLYLPFLYPLFEWVTH
jgi:NADH-quinone oxidoreductase subunit N